MRRAFLLSLFLVLLNAWNAVGQTNGPYTLDLVTTSNGVGNPITIGPVTTSQANELSFLIVDGDFAATTNCNNGAASYLNSMSGPWAWAGTARDGFSIFAGSNNNPFTIGYPGYGSGPSAPVTYPFWTLTSSSVSASGSAVWQSPPCPSDWSAVLATFKYTGGTIPGSVVGSYTASAFTSGTASGTTTVTGWGLGITPSSPMFLIGYMWTQGGDPSGGIGPYNTPNVSLSDPVGNNYQIITNISSTGRTPSQTNSSGYINSGTHIVMFICNNFKGAPGANTLTINISGGYNGSANHVAIAAVVYQKGFQLTPSIVDPNTGDPTTSMMSGPVVTSNPQLLATGGRDVRGVAADGVTEVVIRVRTTNVGDQVTLTLMNDKNSISGSSDDDGGLGQIGGSTFTQSRMSVISEDTGIGAYAFAIYRAPVDFTRQNSGDGSLAQRAVSLQAQDQTQGGTPSTLPITILRPPVVLVHGLWDNWSAWDHFSPLVTGVNSVDPRFSVGRVSYDQIIGPSIVASFPSYYPITLQNRIRANSMGFDYNAPNVLGQVTQWIRNFKAGNNPLGAPIAAVQADIVGHSMGGVITRDLVLQPSFLNDNTFSQGNIHKVITIDSPHLGSQLAIQLLSIQETAVGACLENLLAEGLPLLGGGDKFVLGFADFADGSDYNGAIEDLQGDDATGQISVSLNTLNLSAPHFLPTALIAGVYTNFSALDSSANATFIRHWCSSDPLAQQLTSAGWPQIFHGNSNDAIVSENSQLDGLVAAQGAQYFGYVHSSGTEKLGFSSPSVLDANATAAQVILLLNTSWKNSAYYYQLKP